MKPSSINARIEDESCAAGEKDEGNCGQPAGNDSVKDERRPAKKKRNKKGKPPSDKKKDGRRRKTPASEYAGKIWLSFIAEKREERRKPSVRCKAERIFLIVKRDFGHTKARYRGLPRKRSGFTCSLPLRTS